MNLQDTDSPLTSASPDDTNPIKIRNWSSDIDPISDETLLIRYMKLETFLLLLRRDLVFIPTLQLLQASDSLEGNISAIAAFYAEKMQPIVRANRKWLLEAAGKPKIGFTDRKRREIHVRALVAETWRKEVAKRRCIWCWNRSTELLNFMWKIYGDRGTAVISTVGSIRKALADAGAEGIVSPVKYIPMNASIPHQEWKLLNENYARPHLFKEAAFKPEREVRFVLKVNPNDIRFANGALVNVSVKTILARSGKIEVSPHMPSTECLNIKDLVFKHRWPNKKFWPKRPKGNPWPGRVEPNLPPGLFADLD